MPDFSLSVKSQMNKSPRLVITANFVLLGLKDILLTPLAVESSNSGIDLNLLYLSGLIDKDFTKSNESRFNRLIQFFELPCVLLLLSQEPHARYLLSGDTLTFQIPAYCPLNFLNNSPEFKSQRMTSVS